MKSKTFRSTTNFRKSQHLLNKPAYQKTLDALKPLAITKPFPNKKTLSTQKPCANQNLSLLKNPTESSKHFATLKPCCRSTNSRYCKSPYSTRTFVKSQSPKPKSLANKKPLSTQKMTGN